MAADKRQGRAGMILVGLAALIAVVLIVAWFNWGRPAPGVETPEDALVQPATLPPPAPPEGDYRPAAPGGEAG